MAEKKKKKKKTGRPPETLASAIEKGKLPESWKKIIIESSVKGFTETEIRAALLKSAGKGVKNITMMWYALKERETVFLEAVKVGKVFAEAWWAEKGRKSLNKSVFQSTPWIFTVKNMFPDHYKDKQEITHGATDEVLEKYKEMSADELIAKQRELAQRLLGIG